MLKKAALSQFNSQHQKRDDCLRIRSGPPKKANVTLLALARRSVNEIDSGGTSTKRATSSRIIRHKAKLLKRCASHIIHYAEETALLTFQVKNNTPSIAVAHD